MSFLIDSETGRITTVQGDSGMFAVTELPTDEDYEIYFAFYDSNRKILGQEMPVKSNKSPIAIINVSASLTDLLKVDINDEFAEYYYGIKLCVPSTGFEDTVTIGNKSIGDLNEVIVYPKQVEGITNTTGAE